MISVIYIYINDICAVLIYQRGLKQQGTWPLDNEKSILTTPRTATSRLPHPEASSSGSSN